MKIPVALSTVHVTVDENSSLEVDLNGQPYADDRPLERDDLRSVIDQITTRLGAAVRVELREADGATYTDIHTPPELPAPAHEEREPETASPRSPAQGSVQESRSRSPMSSPARRPTPTATQSSTCPRHSLPPHEVDWCSSGSAR